jgi:predicted LPLAT superfamily acyltransferase
MSDGSGAQWSGRSRGGGFGHRFFILLIRKAGVGFAYGFLALVVLYFIPFAPRATAAVWFYARRVLGYGRLRAALHLPVHYYRFGQTLIDKIAIRAGLDKGYRFDFDNYDSFLSLLDSGSGVVMIGAHVGCWEAGSRFFGQHAKRLNIVLYDGESQAVKRAIEGMMEEGYKVIPVQKNGLDTILRIKNALDAGEFVCFQGDRHMGDSGTVEAEFMGLPARFPRGPFTIASRMGLPVVFYYSTRNNGGRGYRFHFLQATARSEADLLNEYLRATEAIVRAHPTQWFNFYRFWDTR